MYIHYCHIFLELFFTVANPTFKNNGAFQKLQVKTEKLQKRIKEPKNPKTVRSSQWFFTGEKMGSVSQEKKSRKSSKQQLFFGGASCI